MVSMQRSGSTYVDVDMSLRYNRYSAHLQKNMRFRVRIRVRHASATAHRLRLALRLGLIEQPRTLPRGDQVLRQRQHAPRDGLRTASYRAVRAVVPAAGLLKLKQSCCFA